MDGWMKEGEAHIYGDEITNHIQKSSSQRLHTASILGVFRLDALTSGLGDQTQAHRCHRCRFYALTTAEDIIALLDTVSTLCFISSG